jgi:hypothetical protein
MALRSGRFDFSNRILRFSKGLHYARQPLVNFPG